MFSSDSRATRHITDRTAFLIDIRGTEDRVEMNDSTNVQIFTGGTLVLNYAVDEVCKTVSMADVFNFSKKIKNLLYVSCIRHIWLEATFKSDNDSTGMVVVSKKGSGTTVMR